MKKKHDKVISQRQSASIISSTLIGVGVLTLPRVTSGATLEAGWISVMLGSIFTMVSIFIMTKIGWRFPSQNFGEYSAEILGSSKYKKVGKILAAPLVLAFIGFYLITTASTARTFGEVVVTAVLRETPLEIIIITLLLTSLLLVRHEIDVLARVNEILLPIIIIPVLLLSVFSLQSFEIENFLPIWPSISIPKLVKGILLTLFAFQGYEIVMIFSSYTKMTKKTMRFNLMAIAIPAVTYLLIVVAGIGAFGVDELSLLMWPTLELVKVTQVPGLILERMESAFLGVWVAAVFTTSANCFYASVLLVVQFLKKENKRFIVGVVFLPIIYWLALIPDNVVILFNWQKYIGYYGFLFTLGIPVLFLILSMIRKKGQTTIPSDEDKEERQKTGISVGESK